MSNFVEEFSLDLKMLQSFLQYTLYFNKMVSERLREDIIFLSFQCGGTLSDDSHPSTLTELAPLTNLQRPHGQKRFFLFWVT